MTDKERDLGRVISVSILLLIILIAMLTSCSPYYYQSKGPKVTHVLALTEEGDTLKIPIKDIKPNVIYMIGIDLIVVITLDGLNLIITRVCTTHLNLHIMVIATIIITVLTIRQLVRHLRSNRQDR